MATTTARRPDMTMEGGVANQPVGAQAPSSAPYSTGATTTNVTMGPPSGVTNDPLKQRFYENEQRRNLPGEGTAQGAPQNPEDTVATVRDIANGIPPTNRQLEAIIDKTILALDQQLQTQTLRPHTLKAVEDAKILLLDTKEIMYQKNDDEKLQKFLRATRDETIGVAQTGKQIVPDKAPTIQKRVKETYPALREVVKGLVYSPEFRTLLVNVLLLFKDALKQWHGRLNISGQLKDDQDTAVSYSEMAQGTKSEMKSFVKGVGSDIKHGNLPVDKEAKKDINRRARKLVARLGRHREYHNAVRGLFELFDELKDPLTQVTTKGKEHVQSSSDFNEAIEEAKLILAEFCGRDRVGQFVSDLQDMLTQMRKDDQTRRFFWDGRRYILDVMNNPESVEDEEMLRRWDHLTELGSDVAKKWSNHTIVNKTIDDAKFIITAITNDPYLRKIMKDSRTLAKDFVYDRTGRMNLFVTKEVLEESKDVVIPVIMEHLCALPMPAIEMSGPKFDFAVRGILFHSHDVFPQHVRVSTKSDVLMQPRKEQIQGSVPPDVSQFKLELFNISTHLRDLHFFYRKKTGLRLSDEGFCDVDVVNMRLKLKWSVINVPLQPLRFQLDNVKCRIPDFNLVVKQANHKALYKLGMTFFKNTIRKRMETGIEKSLFERLGVQTLRFDNFLAKLHARQEALYAREAAFLTGAPGTRTATTQPTYKEAKKRAKLAKKAEKEVKSGKKEYPSFLAPTTPIAETGGKSSSFTTSTKEPITTTGATTAREAPSAV